LNDFNLVQNLSGLKDFQLKTVNYVYNRLYSDDHSDKFLLADEVGLGKTLVARGVIAKIIDNFQRKEQKERLDIIYICSNAEIARQNINRLNILDEKVSHASRITLLPLKIFDLKKNKINFISFTPGTSFNLRSNGGVKKERALLYHILDEIFNFNNQEKYIRFFQCMAGAAWPDYLLNSFPQNNKIDPGLKENYIVKMKDNIRENDQGEKNNIKTRLFAAAEEFKSGTRVSDKINYERYKIIGELRQILAQSCITSLNPELVILDEFQRFKDLIDETNQQNELARYLFNFEGIKVLLLSATPYKMYTLKNEPIENHYEDFLFTLGFLLNSDNKKTILKKLLNNYKAKLYSLNEHKIKQQLKEIEELKKDIESILKNVMVRNERIFSSIDYEGMISEKKNLLELKSNELKQYLTLDKIAPILEARNNIEYWKSAPYLLSFMENNYKLKKDFNYAVENNKLHGFSKELQEDLSLSSNDIEEYRKIDPANSRLRNLIRKSIDSGGWKLLWMPASLPYYDPTGVYAEKGLEGFSKDLVFSSWHIVPRVISSFISYEAERRMVTGFDKNALYFTERKTRAQLLNFNISEGRLNGMPLFNLIYPSEFLAANFDPLNIIKEIEGFLGKPNKHEVINFTAKKIEKYLDQVSKDIKYYRTNREDERWYWAAPLILDRHNWEFNTADPNKIFNLLDNLKLSSIIDDSQAGSGKGFREHLEHFSEVFKDPNKLKLGSRPDDLFQILAQAALGSPAISAKRSLYRKCNKWLQINQAAFEIGYGFRNMFNLPDNITLIRGLDSRPPYWLRVLEYCIDGNIQALLDEYIHILYESSGLQHVSEEAAINELKDKILTSLSLRTVSLDFDEITSDSGNIKTEKNRFRCHYALRFGKGRSYQDDGVTRRSQVREAFNSPFKPFVLATTSIGQEGLDFHQYCHSVIHWNLPSNPVDLEQREGRIHRYKSYVIRKNIAQKYANFLLNNGLEINQDPWDILFSKAIQDREDGLNDLNPFWIYETKEGYKVERHVPCYPLSREEYKLSALKRSLALYRMAFGQARQQELIDFIKNNLGDEDISEIMKYRIDLSP